MTDTPAIEVQNLHVGYGATPVLHGIDLAVAPGEFVAILGSSGCGKTTLLADHRGVPEVLGRRDPALRPRRREPSAGEAQHRHGVPILRALAPYDGPRQRRLRLAPARRAAARGAAAGRRGAEAPQPLGPRGAQGHEPLRRPAPARGARAGACHRPAASPSRRAAVEPRRQGARPAAPGDQDAAEPPRLHRDPRHPRPRGGDDHGRPDRGDGCRPHRPGRPAEGGLRPAELALRRELHGGGEHARSRGRPAPGGGCDRRRRSRRPSPGAARRPQAA